MWQKIYWYSIFISNQYDMYLTINKLIVNKSIHTFYIQMHNGWLAIQGC